MDGVKKSFLIIALVIGIIAITVAFATLSTRLSINGTASVPNVSWNIHFVTPWQLDTESTVNGHNNTAEYPSVSQLQNSLSTNTTLVEGLNVTLKQPGDYAKYKFQIINAGTIDAELNSFIAPMTCTGGNNCDDVINYEVKCYDNENLTGSELTTHSVLEKTNGTAYCYLKVEYKDKTNQNSGNAGSTQTYTQEAITASLSASWQWIQRTNSGQSGSNSGNEQGGGSSQTPSNSYVTTFDDNYIAYKWIDAETNGNGYAGFYHGTDDWFTSLDPNSKAYLRTTGSLPEVCGVFGSGQAGTVCMTSSYYNSNYSSAGNYEADFEDCSGNETIYDNGNDINDTCIKGYARAKVEEMLTKGVSSCSFYYGIYYVRCDMISNGYCGISGNGSVECAHDDSGYYMSVGSDGSAS